MADRAPISIGSYACSRNEILAIRRGTITTIVGPATFTSRGGKQRRSGWYKARPGDLVWTKEPTKEFICIGHEYRRETIYEADFKNGMGHPKVQPKGRRGFKMTMHAAKVMPLWQSRTTLEVIGKSFGNVWDISQEDALLCGIQMIPLLPYEAFEYAANKGTWATRPQHAFAKMFQARYGKVPTGENPPYIALAFKVHEKNIGEMLGEDMPAQEVADVEPERDPDSVVRIMDAGIANAKVVR